MTSRFIERLALPGAVLFDGAMGTQLAARGARPGPGALLEAPQTVAAVHEAYRRAGAEVLLTNTLTANRIALSREKLQEQQKEIVATACRLARAAAGPNGFVAGDIGPTGDFLEPVGSLTEAEASAAFEGLARALAAGGVDLFVIETFTEAREMALAIRACKRAAPALPVAATMSFDPARDGFRTNAGVSAGDAAQAMAEAGADFVGANCGSVTPAQMPDLVARFHERTKLPLLIQANAGLPELHGEQVIFRLAPPEYAQGMLAVVRAGARLVGGCCGTTPAHIEALRRALDAM